MSVSTPATGPYSLLESLNPPPPLVHADERVFLNKGDLLSAAILEGPIEGRPFSDDCTTYGRRVLKGSAMVISALAKLPYVPISLTLPAGEMFATANCTSYFFLEYWAISATIDRLASSERPHQAALIEQSGLGCQKASILVSSVTISLVSQIPVGLPVFKYLKPDYPNLVTSSFALLLGAGSLFPTESLYLTFDSIARRKQEASLNEVEFKLLNMGRQLAGIVREHQTVFATQMEQHEMLTLIEDVNQMKLNANAEYRMTQYLEKFLMPPNACVPKSAHFKGSKYGVVNWLGNLWNIPGLSKTTTVVAKVAGAALTAICQTALTQFTYTQTREYLVDNGGVAGLFAGVVVISGSYLTGQALVQSAQKAAKAVVNKFRGERSIANRLELKLTACLSAFGVINSALGLSATWVIWGDYYRSDGAGSEWFMKLSMCGTLFMLFANATLNLVDSCVEELIRWRGNPDAKRIIQFRDDLTLMAYLLEESPILKKAIFVKNISVNLRDRILSSAQLNLEQVSKYIAQHLPDAEPYVQLQVMEDKAPK